MNERDEQDELARAVSELKAFAQQVPREANATRARILSERKRRVSPWWLAAAGVLLIGGPALAQVTGVLPQLVERIAAVLSGPALEPPRQAKQRSRAHVAPVETVQLEPAPLSVTPDPSPVIEEVPRKPSAPRPRRAPSEARTSQEEASITASRALYLEAHRAHFEGGAPEAALRAWDAFLQAAPHDPFAPEARYNRAILLVKLARHADALRALAPFACAAPGAYRQREARVLVTRLQALAPELPALACPGDTP